MEPLYYTNKGRFMNTVEKYFIYLETKIDNQLNDRHTIQLNAIFESLLEISLIEVTHFHYNLTHSPTDVLNFSTTLTTAPHRSPDNASLSTQQNQHVSTDVCGFHTAVLYQINNSQYIK
jgi:hypothetical protein